MVHQPRSTPTAVCGMAAHPADDVFAVTDSSSLKVYDNPTDPAIDDT